MSTRGVCFRFGDTSSSMKLDTTPFIDVSDTWAEERRRNGPRRSRSSHPRGSLADLVPMKSRQRRVVMVSRGHSILCA